ncbi:MAG: hypothetical protein ABWX70_00975 [Hyphomicrobium sp.]
MTRIPHIPGETWPRFMRATTAAAYLDEKSVESFRRRIGTIYPRPVNISGRGEVWLKEDLDKSIDRLSARIDRITDASEVL